MKKYFLIIAAVFSVTLTGCNDWLTVEPRSEVTKDNFLKTDEGVNAAMYGIYTVMRFPSLYHPQGAIGLGLTDRMASAWTVSGLGTDYGSNLQAHNWGTVSNSSTYASSFRQMYIVISNLNPLINSIEEHRETLSEDVFNVVLGEALAVRAFLNFDLMRLYGPCPGNVETSKRYLPYPTVNSPDLYEYYTYDEFMRFLWDDLNRGIELLEKSDPLYLTGVIETNNLGSRKNRFNYYAAIALRARINQWIGNTAQAVEDAWTIIDALGEEIEGRRGKLFNLTDIRTFWGVYNDQGEITESRVNNFIYYDETIFGLSLQTYDMSNGPFTRSTIASGNGAGILVNKQNLINGDNPLVGQVYTLSTDARVTQLMTYTGNDEPRNYFYTRKFEGLASNVYETSRRNMPVIRLSEMYFIIMESGNLADAQRLYTEYTTSRGATPYTLTAANRAQRTRVEFLGEYWGEGQNWFYYKRHIISNMVPAANPDRNVTWTASDYVLPIPEEELGYYNN